MQLSYLRAMSHGGSLADRYLRIEAGQVIAGLAELLALAKVEISFEEGTRWLVSYLLFRMMIIHCAKKQNDLEISRRSIKKNGSNIVMMINGSSKIGTQPERLYGSLDGVIATSTERLNTLAPYFARVPANAEQTSIKNWLLFVMEQSGFGN